MVAGVMSALKRGAAGRTPDDLMDIRALVIEMQPTFGERRNRRRGTGLGGGGVGLAAGLSLLGLAHAHRGFLLVNQTPSEPMGVYVRATHDPVRVGALIAFMAPPGAFPYANRWAAFLRETPILKGVAAVAGDHVCTLGGSLTINGVRRAPVLWRDSRGFTLPHWTGCRRLTAGEVFVFSDRVPNSFDSRYFGPVDPGRAQVYRPLLTTDGLGRPEAAR